MVIILNTRANVIRYTAVQRITLLRSNIIQPMTTNPITPSYTIAFMQRVHTLRTAQKNYFKTRSYRDLAMAKKLEKEIDDELAKMMHYLDTRTQQLDLWN